MTDGLGLAVWEQCVNCRRNEFLLLDMYLVKLELIYHVFQEIKVGINFNVKIILYEDILTRHNKLVIT